MIQAPFWGKGVGYDVFAGGKKKEAEQRKYFPNQMLLSEGHELETLRVLSKI